MDEVRSNAPAFFTDNLAGRSWKPGDMATSIRLDYRAVRATLRMPTAVAVPARVVLALLGSNRLEPMPAGGQSGRWGDWPDPIRYLLWHLRNPFEDLRKYSLGFGYADPGSIREQRISEHLRLWWWGFLPFPYYKRRIGRVQLMLGWKSRGIVSLTVRLA